MNAKLPAVKARDIVRILNKLGFKMARQTGSHLIFRHSKTHKIIPVPNHPSIDIKKGTLKSILKQAEIKNNDFIKLLKE